MYRAGIRKISLLSATQSGHVSVPHCAAEHCLVPAIMAGLQIKRKEHFWVTGAGPQL